MNKLKLLSVVILSAATHSLLSSQKSYTAITQTDIFKEISQCETPLFKCIPIKKAGHYHLKLKDGDLATALRLKAYFKVKNPTSPIISVKEITSRYKDIPPTIEFTKSIISMMSRLNNAFENNQTSLFAVLKTFKKQPKTYGTVLQCLANSIDQPELNNWKKAFCDYEREQYFDKNTQAPIVQDYPQVLMPGLFREEELEELINSDNKESAEPEEVINNWEDLAD